MRYEGPEYEVLEFFCEPGFGPVDPHIHDDHTDSFFVLEGEVEFTIGEEIVRAGPRHLGCSPSGRATRLFDSGPRRRTLPEHPCA